MAFKPIKIIAHHSLTKDSATVSWGAIRKYHTQTLGWSDIGYHAGVELVKSGADLYFEVLMGRMWDIPGAHTRGHNNDSLGICFIGNFDNYFPEQKLLMTGAKVISLWLKLFDLKIEDIYPHNHFAQKSCPGSFFDLNNLKIYIS